MKIPKTEINIIQKGAEAKLPLFTSVYVNHHNKQIFAQKLAEEK